MSIRDEHADNAQDSLPSEGGDSSTVLELFGVELKVRNERLAEVLKMDAREALATEVGLHREGTEIREQAAETAEAIPDVVIRPSTPHFEEEMRVRAEMRERVSSLGDALGFIVEPDGSWNSPTGIQILTRVAEEGLTPAAASDAVSKVGAPIRSGSASMSTVLFVTRGSEGAEVLSAAIGERAVFDHVRVIALEDLEFIRSLCTAKVLDHRGVLVLLTPVADADVGDLLGIIRSAAG